MNELIARLLGHERVRAARHHIERTDEVTLARQAARISVAEDLVRTRIATARPILFAATVGEEGSGDLRGAKYLFDGKKDVGARHAVPLPFVPAAFIALDGAGLERIVHRALGSRRYHVTFRGPGGHSWAA